MCKEAVFMKAMHIYLILEGAQDMQPLFHKQCSGYSNRAAKCPNIAVIEIFLYA